MKTKILLFSPPFAGHLNVLKAMVSACGNRFTFKVVITGWKNIPPDLGGVGCETIVLEAPDLHETDPVIWTFPRVETLLPRCLDVAREFNPDLILYDFFSLEGREAGVRLGVPYWCSIPAMVGPFTDADRDYLKRKGVVEDVEMISDGPHRPGQLNLVWSYPSLAPANFQEGRVGEYVFVGNPNEANVRERIMTAGPARIYLSFGTVVMDNIWNQREDVREKMRELIGELAGRWRGGPREIVFATQGKDVLASYPDNWRVVDKADQMKELAAADVFVTHGGSNSFHEAVLNRVPMAVIPFFGDQPLVARRVAELGIGINLVPGVGIDTHEPKDFLGKELAVRLDSAVSELARDERYRKALASLPLEHEDAGNLFERPWNSPKKS